MLNNFFISLEAANGVVLWNWVFWGVSQDSQGNVCAVSIF